MQQNILDTHALIWFIEGDKQLSNRTRILIEGENTLNYVSIASLWEIAIKVSLKKLELQTPFEQINKQLTENGFEFLPVTFADTLTVSTLPFHHRDPFDRLIIAQALNSGINEITKDENFRMYGIKVIW